MDPRRSQHLKTVVARDLTAEQCLDLEAHLREVVASRDPETSLVERTRQVTEAGDTTRAAVTTTWFVTVGIRPGVSGSDGSAVRRPAVVGRSTS